MLMFPFDDVLKLEAEEEALPDIPSFPSIYGQASSTREDTRRDRRRLTDEERQQALVLGRIAYLQKLHGDKQAPSNINDETFVCPHCFHISKPC
jgi:hypothetical protein